MKKLTNLTLLCIGVLVLVFSQTLMAQHPVLLKLYATDHTRTDSLILGLDPAATNHIDSVLGEEEYPPGGPAFDLRFASNSTSIGRDTLKGGTKINYHHMVRVTQTDRWKVAFWSDDSGTAITFMWQIIQAGGNGWTLVDGSPDSALFTPVDMTKITSLNYPVRTTSTIGAQYVYINYFDGLKLTSAAEESVATDAGKKLVSDKKPYLTKFELTVGAAGTPPAGTVGLHVEFGDVVTDGPFSIFATTANPGGKLKVWNLTNPTGPITPPITITGKGDKGKAMKVSKWYWLNAGGLNVEGKTTHKDFTSVSQQFLLNMPNWMNVMSEMYAKGFKDSYQEKGKGLGMLIGVPDTVAFTVASKPKPIFRYNVLPKWGDVAKALWKKGVGGHSATPGQSFKDLLIKGKPILKEVKGAITPDKGNDKLYAEAITLKFNINASDHYAMMENSGFGSLVYNNGGSPFNGWTISKFMDTLAHFMSYGSAGVSSAAADYYAAAHDFNTAFSGKLDTLSFALALGTKVKGVRAVAEVPYLYRASVEMAPVMPVAPYRDLTPVSYKLDQNYPNPFNPTTTIRFQLPEDAFVTLKIYNILGQEVATLLEHQQMDQGINEVTFDAARLASGVYYYRMVINDGQFQQVKKMMLLK